MTMTPALLGSIHLPIPQSYFGHIPFCFGPEMGPPPSQTPAYVGQDIGCRPATIPVNLVGRQATVKFSLLLRCNRKRLTIFSDAVP